MKPSLRSCELLALQLAKRSGSTAPTTWLIMPHLRTALIGSTTIQSTKICTLWLLKPWQVFLTSTPTASLKSRSSLHLRYVYQ